MKNLGLILSYLAGPAQRRNVRLLLKLLAVLVVLVALFATLFHELMDYEGRSYSWATAVYWTLVTMTTLGFGDITFESDPGRIFSVVVLLTGTVFLLILLPFTFIQFVWVPWMARREAERAPRRLPAHTAGHLVLTGLGSIEDNLITLCRRAGLDYVVLVADLDEALSLHDQGYRVMVGPLDDPATYRAAQVHQAAAVVASRTDTANSNIVFTVQEISDAVPIVATAQADASVDLLQLAGADRVLQLGDLLGRALATLILAGGARDIGEISGLHIAEAARPLDRGPHGAAAPAVTPAMIQDSTGVGVVGFWQRGRFRPAEPSVALRDGVLVLAGTTEQLEAYDREFGSTLDIERPVVIIGGGRVGRRVGRSLAEQGVDHRIIERLPERVRDPGRYVVGDAADLDVLMAAGLAEAGAVVVTTHDDDMNIYLTIYVRRLRRDLQVISRANLDRNVSTLYRAGADAVLSYASTGAAAVWNSFRPQDSLLVAEHLEVFRVPVPARLAGRTIAGCELSERTGCGVVAVVSGGTVRHRPDRDTRLAAGDFLILAGDAEDQQRFRQAYPNGGNGRRGTGGGVG